MPIRGSDRQIISQVRGMLLAEFENRKIANPAYSLRAFARDLSLNQSFVSRVMRGERRLSEQTAYQVALALGIPGEKIAELFNDTKRAGKPNKLSDDDLAVLTDWYPFALLELYFTVGFQPNPDFISNKLGLTPQQTDFAIRKLQATKILTIDENGEWHINHSSNNWVSSRLTSMIRKRLQKQILALAQEKLEVLPIEERENMSMTIAVNSSSLPEIRTRIREFNESLRQYINTFENRDAVFQFAIAAYPLTQADEKPSIKVAQ